VIVLSVYFMKPLKPKPSRMRMIVFLIIAPDVLDFERPGLRKKFLRKIKMSILKHVLFAKSPQSGKWSRN